MGPSSSQTNRRRLSRVPAVLPVRVRGTDQYGKPFEEIAHTLDITATGCRIAAIHHPLRIADHVTVVYRQRRVTFLIVWVKLIDQHEFQVGLQTIKRQQDAWGLNPSDSEVDIPRSDAPTKSPGRREVLAPRGTSSTTL
jgi:hypothetical protein